MKNRILGTSLILGLASASMAQFTPGRLIYQQVSGSPIPNTGSAVRILQINKNTSAQTPVNLGDLDSTSTGLVVSGSATTEQSLSRSLDGRFLLVGGYRGPAAATSISAISPGTRNRVLGRITLAGATNFSTTRSVGGSTAQRMVLSTDGRSLWMVNETDGLVFLTGGLGADSSTTGTIQSGNFRSGQFVGGNFVVHTTTAMTRFTGTPTTSTTGTGVTLTNLASAGSNLSAVTFVGDANTGGNLVMYVAMDTLGRIARFTSTNGIAGPFTFRYTMTAANGYRSITSDGSTIFATTSGSNNNRVDAIHDPGPATFEGTTPVSSATVETLISAVGTTNFIKGIALAPEPVVVDSQYNASGTAGSVMTLRSNNGSQRQLRVGLVPDSAFRSWTNWATLNYAGHAVETALDADGDAYVLIQDSTSDGTNILNRASIRKVTSGGTVTSSSNFTLPVGYEAFAVAVDSTERPIVALRPLTGAAQVRFVRWNAALDTATGFDNAGTGWSNGTQVPLDISVTTGDALRGLFATGSTMSTRSWDSTFGTSASTANVAIAPASGVNLNPIRAQFGTDGALRVLSVGSEAAAIGGASERAAFRIDTLNGTHTAVATTGTAFRRDATGGATANAHQWALNLSMGGTNVPRLLLTGATEPNTGPAGFVVNGGAANANDTIIGSGRVWTMDTSNGISGTSFSSYRFAPGYAPVN